MREGLEHRHRQRLGMPPLSIRVPSENLIPSFGNTLTGRRTHTCRRRSDRKKVRAHGSLALGARSRWSPGSVMLPSLQRFCAWPTLFCPVRHLARACDACVDDCTPFKGLATVPCRTETARPCPPHSRRCRLLPFVPLWRISPRWTRWTTAAVAKRGEWNDFATRFGPGRGPGAHARAAPV